ncbi:MAG: ATP-binding cassette domain-containing protein [Deltaproteobacteria bacterium]
MTRLPSGGPSLGLVARLRARVGALAIEANLETGPGALALVGPNGAGKSTLLALILGARRPDAGHVAIDGETLFDDARGIDVPIERRRLGYVPQGSALFPHLDVRGNVAFAARHGLRGASRDAREGAVARVLGELGLTPLASRAPSTLSGGERQRVALARALVVAPRALLLDEPFASLDVLARGEVRARIADTLARHSIPAILVTHDARDVRTLADRVAVLEAGACVQSGAWSDLAAAPATELVRSLVE